MGLTSTHPGAVLEGNAGGKFWHQQDGASKATSAAQVGACFRFVIKAFFRALSQRIFRLDLQDTLLISSSPVLNVCSVPRGLV